MHKLVVKNYHLLIIITGKQLEIKTTEEKIEDVRREIKKREEYKVS